MSHTISRLQKDMEDVSTLNMCINFNIFSYSNWMSPTIINLAVLLCVTSSSKVGSKLRNLQTPFYIMCTYSGMLCSKMQTVIQEYKMCNNTKTE